MAYNTYRKRLRIIYMILNKTVIEGMTSGAVKG